MTHPTFQIDAKLRAACADRCAEGGDPPCYSLGMGLKPCGECLRDVGVEPGDEFDEEAAVGRLV